MPRNGSGGFNLVTNTWSPAINGVSATAADWQALINDLAAAVQQSISADGQTPVTGSLNMGNNRLTALSAGTATGHSLRFEQLFSQGLQQDIAAGATVDIGAGLSVLVNVTGTGTITSFGTNYNGPRYLRFAGVCTLTNSATLVLPGGANITTASGDSAIVVPLGNPATGWRVVSFTTALPFSLADDSVTFAKIQNVATATILGRSTAGTGDVEALTGAQATALLVAASDTVSGRVELATNAETQTGTDTTRAVTPAGLTASALGMGQTWQNVTGSRAIGTTYTNTTGRPISVSVSCNSSSNASITIVVSGVSAINVAVSAASPVQSYGPVVVPNGESYSVNLAAVANLYWTELR